MAKKNIFVVEDEEDILDLIRHHLTKEGFVVATATDGLAAVKAISRKPPDLVLLDLMLPGLDGLEVCRRLKKDPKTAEIPVLMVTAKDEESDVVAGLELGADDYIVKPFRMKELIARVRTALRRQRPAALDKEAVVKAGRHRDPSGPARGAGGGRTGGNDGDRTADPAGAGEPAGVGDDAGPDRGCRAGRGLRGDRPGGGFPDRGHPPQAGRPRGLHRDGPGRGLPFPRARIDAA